MAESTISLPDDVLEWIGELTKGEVTHADRVPGGATREAWFVDVKMPDGSMRDMFVRYSTEQLPPRSAFHPLKVEAEMMMALHAAGANVPNVWGSHPTREAILADRLTGGTWFYRIQNADEQISVANDFMKHLAKIHTLDPRTLNLPSFGEVKSAKEHALDRLRDIRWRGTAPDGSIDPLLDLTVRWLERNVPDYDGPTVVIQGDTGPGNFMYENGGVSAIVDWELSHFGDPMDDIAWVSLRTVQDTFTHLPDRLKVYEEHSGHKIDEARVWYYRLFAEATMVTLRPNEGGDEDAQKGRPAARDIGNGLMYPQLHRRLWLIALTKAMGIEFPMPSFPEPGPAPEWHGLYDDILGNLQHIVPRIADPLANGWAKGLARAVKYLQEIDLSGRDFAELELDDIAAVLGSRPESLKAGRAALAKAAADGKVDEIDYVRVLWNKTMRDDYLMRTASGALSKRTWPPVVD